APWGHWAPNLTDFRCMLRSPSFTTAARTAGFGDQDIGFLVRELADSLEALVAVRNPAEHDHQKSWRRQEVEPLFHRFLGIESDGTLLALLKIWVGRVTH